MILVSFWRYPDPDPYRLKRIRIRPNDTDPYGSGSGSTTLILPKKFLSARTFWSRSREESFVAAQAPKPSRM